MKYFLFNLTDYFEGVEQYFVVAKYLENTKYHLVLTRQYHARLQHETNSNQVFHIKKLFDKFSLQAIK